MHKAQQQSGSTFLTRNIFYSKKTSIHDHFKSQNIIPATESYLDVKEEGSEQNGSLKYHTVKCDEQSRRFLCVLSVYCPQEMRAPLKFHLATKEKKKRSKGGKNLFYAISVMSSGGSECSLATAQLRQKGAHSWMLIEWLDFLESCGCSILFIHHLL